MLFGCLEGLLRFRPILFEFVNAAELREVERIPGRKFQSKGGADAAMPDGPSIFETTGAWEDFATPARDLRLLIAMDVVRSFPDRVNDSAAGAVRKRNGTWPATVSATAGPPPL